MPWSSSFEVLDCVTGTLERMAARAGAAAKGAAKNAVRKAQPQRDAKYFLAFKVCFRLLSSRQ